MYVCMYVCVCCVCSVTMFMIKFIVLIGQMFANEIIDYRKFMCDLCVCCVCVVYTYRYAGSNFKSNAT